MNQLHIHWLQTHASMDNWIWKIGSTNNWLHRQWSFRSLCNGVEPFLLYDSEDDADRLLIFSTSKNLTLLSQLAHWMTDSTYQSTPEGFYQFLTIHGFYNEKLIVLAYVLMPNATVNTYKRVFETLLNLQPGLLPEKIVTEFEINIVMALRSTFPETAIEGRFYHLCQNVFKRIQLEGLQNLYQNDLNFSIKVRMLPALAFVPPEQVRGYFEEILSDFPPEAKMLPGYFEDMFIGRLRQNCNNEEPSFPIPMWNMFHKGAAEMHISNALILCWHESFRTITGGHKMTAYKFFKALVDMQQIISPIVDKLLLGQIVDVKTKKGMKENNRTVVNTVQNFGNMEVKAYLSMIASNIGR